MDNQYQIPLINSQKDAISTKKLDPQSRINRLKEIDTIYKAQIEQIYNSKTKDKANIINSLKQKDQKLKHVWNKFDSDKKMATHDSRKYQDDNISTSSRALQSVLSQEKHRSSRMINLQTSRGTNNLLNAEIENKDIKIRQLTSKCEYLLLKLKNYINANEYSQEVEMLGKISQNKIERFQNFYKIKNQESLFKTKLQISSLLQEFQIPKQQLLQLNDIQTEGSLFTFMAKKIKGKLKTFRIREQQTTFSNKKDKILNEKYEQRIHHLTETSELLKHSELKLKQKNDQLKNQLNEYIEKIKQRQFMIEQKDSQIFRLKKQNQEINSYNNKLQLLEKKVLSEKEQNKKCYEMKQKEMKQTVNTYLIEKIKLEAIIEQKENYIQEIMIKTKYVQQQNERLNRELLRTKQRYQWYQKQLQNKQKEFNEEKQYMLDDFNNYKESNNQSFLLMAKAQTDHALKKVEEYQQAFNHLRIQLEQQRRTAIIKNQEHNRRVESLEEEWVQKVKRIQKIRQQQLLQVSKQYQDRLQQAKIQFEAKQNLLAEQLQSKMKALLAEKDKKMTEKLIKVQYTNEELKRQIQSQNELIHMLQGKK